MDRTPFIALCLAAAAAAVPARAETGVDVYLSVWAASDYIFRGVSQTMSRPTLQGAIDVEHASGLYAGVWVSNVDFVTDDDPDDGARVEFDLTVGYEHALSDDWSAGVSLVRYVYPATVPGADYDYNEVFASVSYGDIFSALVAWSDNTFGEGAEAIAYELSGSIELAHGIALSAQYGHYDLTNVYERSYSYYSVGFGKTIGPVTAQLTFHGTDDAAREIFGRDITSDRTVFTVAMEF